MSEVEQVQAVTTKVLKKRTELGVIREAMKQYAVQNALSNVTDDEMSHEDFEKEMNKAELIMQDAMYKIMAECDFYGDDSIIQETNAHGPTRNTVKDFFVALAESMCDEINTQIN